MKNKWTIISIILFFIIGFIFNNFQEKRNKRLLCRNFKYAVSIYEETFVSKNAGPLQVLNYSINHREYYIFIKERCTFLQKGDTVLIKYSVEDPNIAEVIDFCYMQKHKGKTYCDCEK
jgi:hypothetical protein